MAGRKRVRILRFFIALAPQTAWDDHVLRQSSARFTGADPYSRYFGLPENPLAARNASASISLPSIITTLV